MKARVAGSMVLLSTLLMGAAPEVPPYAVRLEGYSGAIVLDDASPLDDYAYEGGGTGSAVALFGPAYLQADIFGDYVDDLGDFGKTDFRNVGVGGHLGVGSQDMGIVGISGAWQDVDIDPGADGNSLWRIGVEGEYFLEQLTLGVQAGYETADVSDTNGYYANGLIRFYPSEDWKLEGIAGVIDTDDSSTSPVAGINTEYRFGSSPFAGFARWESSFFSSADFHSAVLGFKLYFDGDGGTLKRADRAHFRDACHFAILGTRTC